MDTGLGNMAHLSESVTKDLEKKGVDIFKVGEVLEIKSSNFQVHQILNDFIVLKPLPR